MMKNIIQREEAIRILEEFHFKSMSKQERLDCLQELWIFCDSEEWFDEGDLLYYSKEIREDMIHNEEPSDPTSPKYDYLIKDRLHGMFVGVKNSYLAKLLGELKIEVSKVVGGNDKLDECPCCCYKTIIPGEGGVAQICPVCFWENFGEGPNHMTLKQAQENFKKVGAMDVKFLDAIDPDGKKKYEITITNKT